MTTLDYSKYETPSHVVKDENISDELKISLLEKWKADEEALQRAASEGLHGGEKPNLRNVQKAIDTLAQHRD